MPSCCLFTQNVCFHMALGCQDSDSFSMYLIIFSPFFRVYGASLMAQTVKRLSAMQDTQVWSLGWEDPLKKEMTAHSSILAWKIPWIDEPGKLPSMGSQRVRDDWAISLHFTSLHFTSLGCIQFPSQNSRQEIWVNLHLNRLNSSHWSNHLVTPQEGVISGTTCYDI